jgi:hypothetical protein
LAFTIPPSPDRFINVSCDIPAQTSTGLSHVASFQILAD